MKRAVLLHNPYSGRIPVSERRLYRIVEAVHGLGLEVKTVVSRPLGESLPNGEFDGADVLIVQGGDGTIHSALPVAADRNIPLALLPSGTANVLARELKIPRDPQRAVRLLREGRRARMYLGSSGSHYFHLMAGIGLDSHIIQKATPTLKKSFGVASYWMAGLLAYPDLPLVPFQVRFSDEVHEATFAVVANSRYYGHLVVTPSASVLENHLDICLFKAGNRARFLQYLLAILRGTHLRYPDVLCRKADQVEIVGDPSIAVQMDGEVVGNLPMNLKLSGRSVEIFVPGTG